MGKLGKILAPIAALLAIALAVLSYFIHSGFQIYKDRATNLAETVDQMTKTLNEGSGSDLAGKISFNATPGAKEDGTLSYKNFKEDSATFKNNTGNAAKFAKEINEQRNFLSDQIKEIADSMKIDEPDLTNDNLRALASYKVWAGLTASYANAMNTKLAELEKAIQDAANKVGVKEAATAAKVQPKVETVAPPAEKEQNTEGDQENEAQESSETVSEAAKKAVYVSQATSFKKFTDAVSKLKNKNTALENAIVNVGKSFKQYTIKAKLADIKGDAYAKVLKDLENDFKAIDKQLKELKDANEKLKKEKAKLESDLKAEKSKLETERSSKNKEIANLKKQLSDTKIELGNLKAKFLGDDADKPDITDKSQIDQSLVGKVLIDNQKWNYLIVDLGKKDVIADVRILVNQDGKYLGSGIIKEVHDGVSQVEITSRVDNASLEGAKVTVNLNSDDNATQKSNEQ